MGKDNRLDWVDAAKGLSILLVVMMYAAYNLGEHTGQIGVLHYIIGFATPVDEHNCRVFFWRCRKVGGWQRDVWRFLYKTRLEGLHWEVLEQDRVVLEAMADDAREHEFLYQHDSGMSRVRRMLRQKAEQQIAALEAAHVDEATQ